MALNFKTLYLWRMRAGASFHVYADHARFLKYLNLIVKKGLK